MADTLAELGAGLVLVDRPGSDLAGMSSTLLAKGVRVWTKECDLEVESQRAELSRWVHEERRHLSVLINNAAFVGTSGLTGWAVPFDQQSVETWRRAIEVNLTAAFSLCQSLQPALEAGEGASIINIASIYGVIGPDWSLYAGTSMGNPAAYAASKGGLVQLTRWLATTLAPRIRVNSISPGGIARGQPKSFVDRYVAGTPLGRMATEADFIGVVSFLATDQSNYMTGQNLVVDGGRTTL